MRYILLTCLVICGFLTFGQKVTLTPTISPSLFQHNSTITVTYDVTGTALSSLSQAWIWVWIPNVNINAKYNINPATAAADAAKFTKSVVSGRTLFTITFKPSDFFTTDISAQTKLGMLLKASDWPAGQSTDHIANFGFSLNLTAPTKNPVFVATNEQLLIEANTPVTAEFKLYVNENLIDTETGITSYSFLHLITELEGEGEVKVTATSASGTAEKSFTYIVSAPSPAVARPAGIIPGINYDASNASRATLCLWAPGKNSVHVSGEFNNWNLDLLNRDGEFFWIEVDALEAGKEYAFHYLVEEEVWVADPYADKILDPDDQYISNTIYPNLKAFPSEALTSDWYFNRLSVLQTAQTPYAWQVTDFVKPPKEELVIYELLIRDFFESGSNTYKSLADTIRYLKRLGVNAIELMPVMEFGGNNSWGYNPQFMFAPDKAYGTKNDLKNLIDVCHQNGMAVILDIAMNHQDLPNPYLMMDFNFQSFTPTAANKWFNISATHPFNVFYDMNHESTYTKSYLDTVNHYWLSEYKIDGYRFDLSKGFTQVNNPNNVSAWSSYDASRIALLKRMADKIWNDFPEAYVMLEHLSVNSEEKELAEYRANEGKGMMLWGNMNHAYTQLAMGYSESSDISGVYHENRSWSVPHLISYMESHDEERMVYKNVSFGNTLGSYSVKNLSTALNRTKAAATIFYTIPGPKMLWQFGELGYDYSINRCEDGTIKNECRTYPKPVVWDYKDVGERESLFNHVSDLMLLRKNYDLFTEGTATLTGGSGLKKQLILKNNPYTDTPANADEMNAVVAVNFELSNQMISITFPHAGTWFDYYEQKEIQVSTTNLAIDMKAGEYKLFTDVPIETSIVTGLEEEAPASTVQIFPNPVEDVLQLTAEVPVLSLRIITLQGVIHTPVRLSSHTWDLREYGAGMYIVESRTVRGLSKIKIIKR